MATGDSAAEVVADAPQGGVRTRPPFRKGQQVLVLATIQSDYGSEVGVNLEEWWPAWSEILVSEWRVTELPVRTVNGAPLVSPPRA
jgi:hypothetical protein